MEDFTDGNTAVHVYILHFWCIASRGFIRTNASSRDGSGHNESYLGSRGAALEQAALHVSHGFAMRFIVAGSPA